MGGAGPGEAWLWGRAPGGPAGVCEKEVTDLSARPLSLPVDRAVSPDSWALERKEPGGP